MLIKRGQEIAQKIFKKSSFEFLLVRAIKIGVIIILFTQLVVGPFGITLSIYPKTVFFRSVVEFIFILYLLLVYLRPQHLPKVSPLLIAVSVFTGIIFLSALTGVNFPRSFFGDLNRAEGVILHIHLFVFFLILISIFQKQKEWFLLFKINLLVSGLSSIAALLQKFGVYHFYGLESGFRISGTLSNPDFFAPYLVMSIFLGLIVLLIERKKLLKIFWALILVLNLFTLISAQSRAAFLGIIIGIISLFFLWSFYYLKPKVNTRKFFLLLIAFLFFLIFALLLILNQEKLPFKENYFFQRAINFNLSGRLPAWEIAFTAWRERPLLGWGPETFLFLYDKFFKGSYLKQVPEDLYFDRPHNSILGLMATTGTLGTLSYLSIFFLVFYLIFKNEKTKERQKDSLIGLIVVGFFIAHFVQNFFLFDTISTYLVFFLVLGFVNNNFKYKEEIKEEKVKDPPPKPSFQKLIDVFLIFSYIFFSLFAFYQLNYKPTKASLIIIKGAKLEAKDLNLAMDNYIKGLSQKTIYDEDLKIEITERLFSYFETPWAKNTQNKIAAVLVALRPFFQEKFATTKITRNFYELAVGINDELYLATKSPVYLDDMEIFARKAIEFNNQKPRYYQLLGRVEIAKGNYQKGEVLYQKAYELTPKQLEDKIKFYTSLGVAYFRTGEKIKAADNSKKAIEINYYLKKIGATNRLYFNSLLVEKTALVYCLDLNDLKTCYQLYEKAIELFPNERAILKAHLEDLKNLLMVK